MRSLILATCLVLTGCTNLQSETRDDGALATVRIPSDADCQYRRFEGHGGSGRLGVMSGLWVIVTITGPDRCYELLDQAGDLLKK